MNQIDQIKEILFSNEKRALDALTRRLEKRESRVADISDVLPEALGRSNVESDRLGKALREPVEKCIKESVSRDPNSFADALFPVIGPAIRKSIAEALKTFSESMNRTIEEKTSIKSIRWRMQASRAGIPYSQFLIQKNLQYRIDHVYLIQPSSGLLIADVHRPDAIRKDDEAVSAMLTAIQDFVSESFGAGDEGILETADIGKYTLWTMRGPHAMLACVINGVPPRGLRDELTENLERIHLQYPEALESFDGTKTEKTKQIEPQLLDCLLQQDKEENTGKEKKKLSILNILLFLALAGLAWLAWQRFALNNDANQLISAVEQEPGVFLTQQEVKKGKIHLRGLLDNTATSPTLLAQQMGIEADKLNLEFKPFHSLEKAIILRRIESKLQIPDGVNFKLDAAGVLRFDGNITSEFKELAESKLANLLGISALSFGEIYYSDEDILQSTISLMQPSQNLNLTVNEGNLSVSGLASYAWLKKLESNQNEILGLSGLNTDRLKIAEIDNITSIQETYNNFNLQFIWRTGLQKGEEAKLLPLANALIAYGENIENIGIQPLITLTGYADNTGDLATNRDLKTERAQYIKGRLVGLGVRSTWLSTLPSEVNGFKDVVDLEKRKVVINLNTDISKFK